MDYYKLIGYTHIAGTSKKTGNPYDGYVLHVTIRSEDPNFVGEESMAPFVDRQTVEGETGFPFQIGDLLDIRFDNRGRVRSVVYGG